MGIQLKPPTRQPPPLLLKVRLSGVVGEKLEVYREMYCENYGEEIRVEALAAEIIGQFLDRDPALRRKWRERHQGMKTGSRGDAEGGGPNTREP